MLQLPNNCRAGSFTVRPANWKSQSAKVKSIWKLSYWFYDDNLKKKRQIVIKGMNRLTTLKKKQDLVRELIDNELDIIQVKGWNHITGSASVVMESELSGATPVIDALEYAFKKLQVESGCKAEIKSCLKYVSKAIRALHFDRLPVVEIKTKHLRLVLDECARGKKKWSASSHNHYRSYLRMLFKEVKVMEAIDFNPVNDLDKKKATHKLRQELTPDERATVKDCLTVHHPRFWTFVNIFFHSGSRETELLRLRKSDVDIPGQRFKVLIKKGKQGREEWRPIKDIVLPDWEKALEGAADTDYVFSKGLKPGKSIIRPEQVTRRWNRIVKRPVEKGGLGITADLYSLKHSNLDEMSEALQAQKEAVTEASEFAGHTTPVITIKHYLKGQDGRKNKTIKAVRNEF